MNHLLSNWVASVGLFVILFLPSLSRAVLYPIGFQKVGLNSSLTTNPGNPNASKLGNGFQPIGFSANNCKVKQRALIGLAASSAWFGAAFIDNPLLAEVTRKLSTMWSVVEGADLSTNGEWVLASGCSNSIRDLVFYSVEKKQISLIQHNVADLFHVGFTTNNHFVALFIDGSVWEGEAGKGITLRTRAPFVPVAAQISQNRKFYLQLGASGEGLVKNLTTQAEQRFSLPGPRNFLPFSGLDISDSGRFVAIHQGPLVQIWDIESRVLVLTFGSYGNSLTTRSSMSSQGNLITGKANLDLNLVRVFWKSPKNSEFKAWTQKAVEAKFVGDLLLSHHTSGKNHHYVSQWPPEFVELPENPVARPFSLISDLAKVRSLCEKTFQTSDWESILPQGLGHELTAHQLGLALLKFQKPGGFVPKRDLSTLLTLIESRAPLKEVLPNIFLSSNILYFELLNKFPALLEKPLLSSSGIECRTADENSALVDAAQRMIAELSIKLLPRKNDFTNDPLYWYLNLEIDENGFSVWNDWRPLYPMIPLLSRLPKPTQDHWIDKIAQSLANSATSDPLYAQIFPSALYYLAAHSVANWFGQEKPAFSDFIVSKKMGSRFVTPLLFSSLPFEDSGTRNAFGFFSKQLSPVPATEENDSLKPLERVVEWAQGTARFEGRFTAVVSKTRPRVNREASFRNQELWADGNLEGVVFTGSNLSEASEILDRYKWHFETIGYQFDETNPIEIGTRTFLETKIAGSVDYLLKESHSLGMDKTITSVTPKSTLLTGRLVREDGKKETVHLLFPIGPLNEKNSVPIENEEFGTWIRKRSQQNSRQLIYISKSCWSVKKAIKEIEAARSSDLLEIPVLKFATAGPFPISTQTLLNGIREGKSFSEIRKKIQSSNGKRDPDEDRYLFPDEADYETLITQQLQIPIDVRFRISSKMQN